MDEQYEVFKRGACAGVGWAMLQLINRLAELRGDENVKFEFERMIEKLQSEQEIVSDES
jgi:hypothetical protein